MRGSLAARGRDAALLIALVPEPTLLNAGVRHGLLEQSAGDQMGSWAHGGGFAVAAAVRIEGADQAGWERPLRYCACPPFALGAGRPTTAAEGLRSTRGQVLSHGRLGLPTLASAAQPAAGYGRCRDQGLPWRPDARGKSGIFGCTTMPMRG
ncbi:MAG: hypothetical protein ACMG6H_12085 [Acidobacteriota bacterium]